MMTRLFGHNLGLKAVSLLLAFVVWVWVAQHSELVKVIKIPVLVEAGPDVLVLDYEPKELRVRVDGDPNDVRRIREEEVSARFEIGSEEVRGRRQLLLTPAPRQISPIPSGVNVEILDRIVEVTVDKAATKQVRIAARLIGRLPLDIEVETVSTEPTLVSVTGPVAAIQSLNHIDTEPIDLNNRRSSFAASVDLAVPDPSIELDPDQVRVVVVLTPKSARR